MQNCIFVTCCGKSCKEKAEYYLVDCKGYKIPLCEKHTRELKRKNKHLYFQIIT